MQEQDLSTRVKAELRAGADELALQLLEVRTNIRALSDPVGLAWDRHYHGAALGGVAQLLVPHVGTVLIPPTFQRANLHPFGSYPDLDPLWSSSAGTVEHHGVDTSRPGKIAVLAESAVAMKRLRACWLNQTVPTTAAGAVSAPGR